jgi:hypothetical protein
LSTYQTPVPGGSGYAGAALLAQKAYDNAMARYKQQRGNTLLSFGYQQKEDGSYGVDPNNEYGRYQQMLKGEANQSEGLERHQAASGWGTSSGYLGRQREDLSYAQGGEQAALGTDLTGQLADITSGEQQAAYDKDAALYQAEQAAAEQAIANQQFNPGDYTGLDDNPADPASPAAPGAKKSPPLRKATPAVHKSGRTQLLKAAAKKQKKGGKR